MHPTRLLSSDTFHPYRISQLGAVSIRVVGIFPSKINEAGASTEPNDRDKCKNNGKHIILHDVGCDVVKEKAMQAARLETVLNHAHVIGCFRTSAK